MLEALLHFLGCCGVFILSCTVCFIAMVLVDLSILVFKDIVRRLRK